MINIAAPTSVGFTLDDICIRQIDGLYSLNDLHRASGGELRHRPVEFLRLEQTQALQEEMQKGGDSHLFVNIVKGRNGGTYACRELVIAYAAWISPAFHLKVIRVFLAAAVSAPPSQEESERLIVLAGFFAGAIHLDLFKHFMTTNGQHHTFGQRHRYVLSFDADCKPHVIPMHADEMILSLSTLAERILEPGGLLPSNKELAELAAACSQRLASRMAR